MHRNRREPFSDGLRDAEVDDLGHGPFLPVNHENVGRLDVPVDHSLLVRVLQACTDVQDQSNSIAGVELVLFAVFRDRKPVHQLHRKEGPTLGRAARVEDLGDGGVIHHGHRLAFRFEARNHFAGVHAALQHLDGHQAA